MSAFFFETEDGAKIYYEDHGKGDVILLVHGWMCSSKFWKANVPELAKEFRVVTIDQRGHGYSSKTLWGHTVPQYARDVRALIEHLPITREHLYQLARNAFEGAWVGEVERAERLKQLSRMFASA